MRVTDAIFALIAGRFIGFVLDDFFSEWGITLPFYEVLVIWVILPFFALFCLWLAQLIGRRLLFVFQSAKHILVGGFATVIDLKVFEFLIWLFSLVITINPLVAKSISFIIATLIKYVGNKFWTFQKHEKENITQEAFKFLFVMSIGLLIDISIFYYLSHVIGPQFLISQTIWVKISVLVAAVVAAIWNFLGDKFLVFKK